MKSRSLDEWFSSRDLEHNFPHLIPFLSRGMDVLDVGCGPGTVTVGTASLVQPGTTTGIDADANMIRAAREAADASGLDNIHLVEAGAYELPFADDSFDLCYTRDVMHFLVEPVRALQEQRRVTKPGGRVVAFAVDWGTMVAHPDLPTARRVIEAWKAWPDTADPTPFLDMCVGRKLASYLKATGLQAVNVQGVVQDDYCVTAGGPGFETWYPRLTLHFDLEGPGKANYESLFDLGLVEPSDVAQAAAEIDRWHSDPNAFFALSYFLAWGSV